MLQTVEWSTFKPGTASLFWNPGAVSYLAEFLLASVLAAYLMMRVYREWRQRRLSAPTALLALMMTALVPTFLTSMLRVLSAGGWVSYAMPWSPPEEWTTLAMPWARPLGGVAATAMVLFAYLFPVPLRGAKNERRIAGVALALLTAMEMVVAARTDLAMLSGKIWWRPEWIAGWMHISMIWTAAVFWRQFASAQSRSHLGRDRTSWMSRLGHRIASVVRPAPNREAAAARAFAIFTMLPIIHTAALLLPSEGQFGRYPLDILICWSVLVQLVGLMLVFVGYVPERSSFLFKSTVISLAVLLAAINGTAWIIAPAQQAEFRAPGMISSHDALHFRPDGDRTYAVEKTPFAPLPVRGLTVGAAGARISLPFAFRFYGRPYRALYVSGRGAIGFDHVLRPSDAAFGRGTQPSIIPLLVSAPRSGTRIVAASYPDRLVVTRLDRCSEGPRGCYGLQTIARQDGSIDIQYLYVPEAPQFWLFDPVRAPWLAGLLPGPAGEGVPVIHDYYRAFLAYLDRLYAPIVDFAIVATLIALLGMAALFQGFLIAPLNRLLFGIHRFRNGDLDVRVAVSFNDEVGYLAESFNEMASTHHALTQGLENTVAERVAEVADITVKNAQLEERNRLSANLHDAVAQTLASASLHANALLAQQRTASGTDIQAVERVAQLNRHALNEMRLLLTELRSEHDGEWSLTDRLADLIGSFSRLHSLAIDSELTGGDALPLEVRAVFYRVAQEALNNVVKHSQASHVTVEFEDLEDRALLVVSDNGRGFTRGEAGQRAGLGTAIMHDRARLIGATLELESHPGNGCTIAMTWIRRV